VLYVFKLKRVKQLKRVFLAAQLFDTVVGTTHLKLANK